MQARILNVVFEKTPFVSPKSDASDLDKIHIDDESILAPLSFRDMIANDIRGRVEIVALQFGCLDIDYLLPEIDFAWKAKLIGRDWSAMATAYSIRTINLAGARVY